MEYVIFTFLTWLVLCIAGLPICLTVLPSSLRRYSLQFSPLLGFSYFAFFSYYLYRMNIGGTDKYALLLFLIPVTALVVLYARRSSVRTDLILALNGEAALIFGLCLVAMAIVSAPFFSTGLGHALASSMSNLDIVELAVVSRYLQEFAPNSHEGFLGQSGHLIWTCRDVWFGPSDIVAIISSLLHAEPYQLQTLVMDVIAVQAVGFVYLLAKIILGFGRVGSTVLGLLYAISPVFLYTLWQSFGGQMFAISLMLAAFVIQLEQFKHATDKISGYSHLGATVILFSGIILSYHYMVLVACLLIATYIGCHAVFSRQWNAAGRAMLGLFMALTACALLNPLRVKGLIDTLGMLNSNNGWFIPWISPDLILGANTGAFFAGVGSMSNRPYWAALASLPFLLAIWRLARSPESVAARSFFTGLMLPAFLLGVWFAFREQQAGIWGSYRSFKITASFSSLLLLGAAIPFVGSSWREQRLTAAFAAVLVTVSGLTSVTHMLELARFTEEHVFLPGPDIAAIKKIESMPFVSGINVMDADAFSLLWTNYFTLKTHQVYQKFPYGGRPVGELNQKFSLAKNKTATKAIGYTQDIFAVEASTFESEYALSSTYKLYKAQANRDVTITPGEGWWPAEPTHRWSGSNKDICSVYIDSRADNTEVYVDASYMDMPDGRSFSVVANGTPLPCTQDKNRLQTAPFRLKTGRNLVEFRTNFMPEPPRAWDARTLSVAWTSLIAKFPTPNKQP